MLKKLIIIFIVCFFYLNSYGEDTHSLSKENPVYINHKEKKIYLYTELNKLAIGKKNNHFGIVYIDGSVSKKGMFHSYIDPLNFFSILYALGATPGDNLTSNSTGKFVAGSSLDVKIIIDGKDYSLSDVIEDTGGKGFDIRFGGNYKTQRELETGCIMCLESCYAGITSNSKYPLISNLIRFIKPNSSFSIKKTFIEKDRPFIFLFRIN